MCNKMVHLVVNFLLSHLITDSHFQVENRFLVLWCGDTTIIQTGSNVGDCFCSGQLAQSSVSAHQMMMTSPTGLSSGLVNVLHKVTKRNSHSVSIFFFFLKSESESGPISLLLLFPFCGYGIDLPAMQLCSLT